MSKSENYPISIEVYKYPYCGKINNTENYLSDKICCYTAKICKKFIKRTKLLIFSADFILRLTNGVVSSQAICLLIPISPQTPLIMNSINSNADCFKKTKVDQITSSKTFVEMDFSKEEINQ